MNTFHKVISISNNFKPDMNEHKKCKKQINQNKVKHKKYFNKVDIYMYQL